MNYKNKISPYYRWYQDKKILAIFALIIISTIFILGFVEIPFLSSIHRYTIGMLFGYHSVIFYLYAILICLKIIFFKNFSKLKFINLSHFSFWFLFLAIILFSVGGIPGVVGYQRFSLKALFTNSDETSWKIKTWWEKFTKSESAWFPKHTNGGFVGALLYSIFASLITGIGVFFVSILWLLAGVSLVFYSSFSAVYKKLIFKKVLKKKQEELPLEKQIILKEKDKKNKIDNPFDEK